MDADQLAHVEALANTLFSATSSGPAKVEAQQALLMLQSSADYIPQCQSILDYSVNPFAHLVAAQSLEKLITQFWNNFTVQQKADLCTYVLTYLGEKGVMLEDVVIGELAKLTCRITKLGWFDDMQFREIIQEITRFLQATLDHHLIGLRILCELVDEMNAPTSGRTLTQHRKTAVSFRDHSLFRVFQIAITTLKHLQVGVSGASQEQEHSMGHLALKLAVKCLSFDFIGTNPDESGEDVGTVQVGCVRLLSTYK
jgi:exportin-7